MIPIGILSWTDEVTVEGESNDEYEHSDFKDREQREPFHRFLADVALNGEIIAASRTSFLASMDGLSAFGTHIGGLLRTRMEE